MKEDYPTIESVDDQLFQFYDNLNVGGVLDISEDLKDHVSSVLQRGNGYSVTVVDGLKSIKYNFFMYPYIRDGDDSVGCALNELRKQKQNCNWQLTTKCTKAVLEWYEQSEYVFPLISHEDLEYVVRFFRCVFVMFPCDLAFHTLEKIVQRHTELIGKGDLLIPDYYQKYITDGGWCSREDFDDEIWDAYSWFDEWTYEVIITGCVDFTNSLFQRNSNASVVNDVKEENKVGSLIVPSPTRLIEIAEEKAAFLQWQNMHKHDDVIQQLIDVRKKLCWDRAKQKGKVLPYELKRWKNVVRLMPCPLAFEGLETVMKIHENYLGCEGLENRIQRYKEKGGWFTKKDFDEKTMAAWIRVQVLESRFKNLHV